MQYTTKPSLVADPLPTVTPPTADRVFALPTFTPAGEDNVRVISKSIPYVGYNNPVLTGSFTAQLWIKVAGTWTAIGSPVSAIPWNQIIAFPTGPLRQIALSGGAVVESSDAFIQITAAVAVGANFITVGTEVEVATLSDIEISIVTAGSATAANQVLEIAQLTTIAGNTTGAATAAKQDTGNASLATVATNTGNTATYTNRIPPQGSALMAGSLPVTLATDGPGVASLASIATSTGTTAATTAATGAAVPATASQVAGAASGTIPAATTAGKLKALWTDLVGASMSRLVDPADADLFPAVAAGADGVTNATTLAKLFSYLQVFNGTTWDRLRSSLYGIIASPYLGVLSVLPIGRYLATRNTLADTNATELQVNTRGDLSMQEQFAPAAEDNGNQLYQVAQKPLANGAYSYSRLVAAWGAASASALSGAAKAAPGVMFAVYGKNRNAASRWLQFTDVATGTPGTPILSIEVPSGGILFLDSAWLGPNGMKFSTGITYGWSTSVNTYVAAAQADVDTTIFGA